ncbi:MAG: SH3 domain-containing protein [Tunicatimonas sp.]|uniref:SH3 domain-containing protein n=1 Tax=Tunicatimonas sp. TaxID=1940096 RepID=UPI003C750E2D
MMNFQKVLRKFILTSLLGYFNIIGTQIVWADTPVDPLIAEADSLYELRQYTESFRLYEQLFYEEQQASPAMLLKMAFIQESLNEYSEALYYLNEYYQATSDELAIEKMQELSAEHQLRGFEYTDYDLFYNLLRKYRYFIIFGVSALLLALLAYAAFRKPENQSRRYGLQLSMLVAIGLLFYVTNYSVGPSLAIIMNDYVPIMNGPSSGADVIYISEKGHRVRVEGEDDVWAKIEWNGETAYIRQGNLRPI